MGYDLITPNRLRKFFKYVGYVTEPLGYIATPILSIFTPRESIENSLNVLGWKDITIEMVSGSSLFMGMLIGIPITAILMVIAGNLGLVSGLLLILVIAGYIYQLLDEMTFRIRYDFTFFTPLALEVMALELLRTNDKDEAISRLVDYNLGFISKMVNINVIQKFRKSRVVPSKFHAFVQWLEESAPSEFFRYYALQMLSYDIPEEHRLRELVEDAQNRMYSILEDKLTSSSLKIQLSIVFAAAGSVIFALLLALLAGSFRINTPIAVAFYMFITFVIDIPLFIYDISASAMRGYYIIDKFKL